MAQALASVAATDSPRPLCACSRRHVPHRPPRICASRCRTHTCHGRRDGTCPFGMGLQLGHNAKRLNGGRRRALRFDCAPHVDVADAVVVVLQELRSHAQHTDRRGIASGALRCIGHRHVWCVACATRVGKDGPRLHQIDLDGLQVARGGIELGDPLLADGRELREYYRVPASVL